MATEPRTDAQPLLEVRKLEVVYNKVITAVQGVSLKVYAGQVVAIMGVNGAGKTTTLRAVSGFLKAEDVAITDGEVLLEDAPIHGQEPNHTMRRGVVLVPERNKVFETLTVEDNLGVQANGGGRRWSLDEVYHYFPRLAERRRSLAGYLSGGERQMLAIGSALLCAPRVLLVDELSLGLAPVTTQELMAAVRRINRDVGLTIVLVEQNAAAALQISDYGYVMENGRVVYEGTARRLQDHEDVREFYLGGSDSMAKYQRLKQYRRKRRWWG